MAITRDEIMSVLGPVDEALVAEIAATDATGAELREAAAWLNADEALVNQGQPLPGTRVAALIDLIEGPDEEADTQHPLF